MGSASEFDGRAEAWDSDPAKVERARRVAAAIAVEVPDLARRSVLDYGAGTGLLGMALLESASAVTLADVSEGMLAVARAKIARAGFQNARTLRLDLATEAPPSDRFDLVCTLMTLHHVPDLDGLLRAFHAVLAPGGVLCASDLDSEDGSFHGPGFGGHRGFDRASLEGRIRGAGFGPVRFVTPFVVERLVEGLPRRYPLFLAVARRDP
jgi:2-polyprenyl-3-methyl-5-hydroxy-6-metoxy-1,4-benzoquinol methylase